MPETTSPQPLPNTKHIVAAIMKAPVNGAMADAFRKAAKNHK